MSPALSYPPTTTPAAPPHGKITATAKAHARLISSRRVDGAVLVFIEDNGITRLIRATRADQSELSVLSPTGRAQVQSAVLAMHLAMHGGPNETKR